MAAAAIAVAGEDLNSNSNSDSAQSYMNFPLLRNRQDELGGSRSRNNGRGETTSLAVLLGRVTGRRGASVMVRETAARQLEERRADWGYSKPVVALDVMWNLLFVIVSVVMLLCTLHEKPNSPVRVWICGYAFQCFVHVVLVWVEYRRRISSGNSSRAVARRVGLDEESLVGGTLRNDDEIDNEEDDGRTGTSRGSVAKRIESVNTMISFLWWIVGFYWVVSGGDILFRNAPRLYWLSVVFLAFDVIFAIFCVVLACLIGIALCCCLPCIIAILYAVYGQEGASDTDLSTLPKYRFHSCKDEEKFCAGTGRMIPIETTSGYLANERLLLPEDTECCICLSSYEDGVELHALPCTHHFHAACIVKWLKMKAWCPLCKYDILKGVNESV